MTAPVTKHKRWTAKRKFDLIVELLKSGVSLDEISRETGQPAHVISKWRDEFFEKGSAVFQEAETPKEKILEAENVRLKTKIGGITMDNDLLYEKIARMEKGIPFRQRKLSK